MCVGWYRQGASSAAEERVHSGLVLNTKMIHSTIASPGLAGYNRDQASKCDSQRRDQAAAVAIGFSLAAAAFTAVIRRMPLSSVALVLSTSIGSGIPNRR